MLGIGPGTNLPPPPVLGNLDPVKLEEIRRTIYVGNLEESVSHILSEYYHIAVNIHICHLQASLQYNVTSLDA